MAFAATVVANSGNIKGRGLKFDGYSLEVQAYTKLTGDTTGTVTPTLLKRIDAVYVFNADGSAIAATAVITNTTSPSVALTVLGTGTAGVVLLKGGKR